MKKNNDVLYTLIKEIENAKSPGMYLGKVSLILMQVYLYGFEEAQNRIGYSDFRLLFNFNFFVADYFHGTPNAGWANIILHNTSDENEAFKVFFELYHKYANSDYEMNSEKWYSEKK